MRINVYDEELGEGVEIVEKISTEGVKFYGLRVWLKSPEALMEHMRRGDDDRSAVTFWSADHGRLGELAQEMLDLFISESPMAPDSKEEDT